MALAYKRKFNLAKHNGIGPIVKVFLMGYGDKVTNFFCWSLSSTSEKLRVCSYFVLFIIIGTDCTAFSFNLIENSKTFKFF